MKFFCYSILFFLVISQSAGADSKDPNCIADNQDPNYINELLRTRPCFVVKDSEDPNVLLKCTWDAVINVINAEDVDQKTKEKVVDRIISPIFDFSLMSKLALGRNNWSRLTEPQRERFIDLFVERLRSSYRDKMLLYTGQKVLFKPGVYKGRSLRIPMDLISEDSTATMLYKLRNKDKRWKIYDVEIEGISIVSTYRSQFNDVLGRGSVEDLFSLLEKPAVCDKALEQ